MQIRSFVLAGMMLWVTCSRDLAAGRIYIGDGSNSCGAWTQERGWDSQRSQLWKGWVLGFVSGADIYETNPEILSRVDAPAIYAWIDNYCRLNPLENVQDAAVGLILELLRRAKQPSPRSENCRSVPCL
jgi:hypothetical protein